MITATSTIIIVFPPKFDDNLFFPEDISHDNIFFGGMSIVLERDVDLTYKQWFEEERSFKDDDPIASNCEYKSFRSNSKGKGRRRKMPRQIALIGYNGKF